MISNTSHHVVHHLSLLASVVRVQVPQSQKSHSRSHAISEMLQEVSCKLILPQQV